MSNDSPKTRYHAQVKVIMAGRDVTLNIFADGLPDIYRDLALIVNSDPQALAQAAPPEIIPNPGPAPAPRPKPKPTPATQPAEFQELPVCVQCGEWDGMELIQFTDKRTGAPREAWKCQNCDKWHFPNGKGR